MPDVCGCNCYNKIEMDLEVMIKIDYDLTLRNQISLYVLHA